MSYPIEIPITLLRKQLQIATADRSFHEHAGRIAAIGGHSIREVPANDPRRPKCSEYNCFAFALDLADSAAFQLITASFDHIQAGSAFVDYLLSKNALTPIEAQNASECDVVIYFDQQKAEHGARTLGAGLISKWGDGLLWEHALHEVPAQYGTTVRHFHQMSSVAAESAFVQYVREEEEIILECLPAWRSFAQERGNF